MKYELGGLNKSISNIRGMYNPDDALEHYKDMHDVIVKGKQKHHVGDIIVIGGKKHIVTLEDGKIKYKYYGQGTGEKAQQHAQQPHKHNSGFQVVEETAKKPTNDKNSKQYKEWLYNEYGITDKDLEYYAKQAPEYLESLYYKYTSTLKSKDYTEYDPNGYAIIKQLGGSTGAVLVEKDGKKYVRKTGASKEHLANEVRSIKYYGEMGVPVPKVEQYDKVGGYAYFEHIEGKTYKEWYVQHGADTDIIRSTKLLLQQHFVADCLMGNWDVMGLNYDNVIVTPNGIPYRVDVGGSLEYRAQGEKKSYSQWNEHVTEFESLLDPTVNLQTSASFKGITKEDIAKQLKDLQAKSPNCLQGYSAASKILAMRFKNALKQYANTDSGDGLIGTSGKVKHHKHTEAPASSHASYTQCSYKDFFQEYPAYKFKVDSDSHQALINQTFKKLNDTLNFSDAEVDYIKKNWNSFLSGLGAPTYNGYINYKGLDDQYSEIDVSCEGGSLKQYAQENGMTALEALAIRVYTGSSYTEFNQVISDIVENSDHENMVFNDHEKMKKYKVRSNEEYFKALDSDSKRIYLMAKLMTRGLHKALNNGGKNVTDNDIACYRRFGTGYDASNLKDVFKSGSIVGQCRMSSKTYKQSAGYGEGLCRMKYTAKALVVENIAHSKSEKEVIFPPFTPMKIQWSEYVPYEGHNHFGKLKVIATNMGDTFLDF